MPTNCDTAVRSVGDDRRIDMGKTRGVLIEIQLNSPGWPDGIAPHRYGRAGNGQPRCSTPKQCGDWCPGRSAHYRHNAESVATIRLYAEAGLCDRVYCSAIDFAPMLDNREIAF